MENRWNGIPAESGVSTIWKTIIWRQFGAAIDMLENAIRACPDELWSDPSKRPAWVSRDVVGFWYLAYHTLFFLDLYLAARLRDLLPLLTSRTRPECF